MRRPLRLAAVLLAFGVATAEAQTVQFKVTSTSVAGTPVAWNGVYVSPYGGQIVWPYTQNVALNCVDYFHEVTLGTVYTANVTSLAGSLANTRFNNSTWYLEAAWLTTQYASPNPGSNPTRQIAIQAAIWNIFASGSPDYGTGDINNPSDEAYWMNLASTHWSGVNAADFYLLTPTNARLADGSDNRASAQEFLVWNPTTTPEPGTLTLLGTGIAVLAAARKRRKRAALTDS